MSRRRVLRGAVTVLYLVVLVVGVILWLRDVDLRLFTEITVNWYLVILASVASMGTRYWMAFAWWTMINRCHPEYPPRFRSVLFVFGQSWMSRYFPIKGAWLVHRLALARRVGVSRENIMASTFVESLTQLGATSVVALLTILFHPATADNPLVALIALLAGIVATAVLASPRILQGLVTIAVTRGWVKKFSVSSFPDLRSYGLSTAFQGVTALLSGLSSALFVLALAGPVSPEEFAYIVGLISLATALGVVAFFAPAGIGVREATIVAGLSPLIGLPSAILVAGASRVWSVILDVLFLGVTIAPQSACRPDGASELVERNA